MNTEARHGDLATKPFGIHIPSTRGISASTERTMNFYTSPENTLVNSERLIQIKQESRALILEAFTPYGLVAARGKRWGDHIFLRDHAEVVKSILTGQPDTILDRKIKNSTLGAWKLFPFHEAAPYDPTDKLYQTKHFHSVVNIDSQDFMINDHSIEAAVKMLDITLKLFTIEEIKEKIGKQKLIAVRDWISDHLYDGLLAYKYHFSKGLTNQGFMDSSDSVQHSDPALNTIEHPETLKKLPPDPITSVEVVAAAGVLHRWAEALKNDEDQDLGKLSHQFDELAQHTKDQFRKKFKIGDEEGHFAHAVDGQGNQIDTSFSALMSEILVYPFNGEFVVDFKDAVSIGRKLMSSPMFNPAFGVRSFEEDHIIEGNDYHLGANGKRAVHWPRNNTRAAIAQNNVAELAQGMGYYDLLEEFSNYVRMLDEATLINYWINGYREQSVLTENGEIVYYGQGNPEECQEIQMFTVEAVRSAATRQLGRLKQAA